MFFRIIIFLLTIAPFPTAFFIHFNNSSVVEAIDTHGEGDS